MTDLMVLLDADNHNIIFEYNRCYIEMYGQKTEFHLRQKYFRRRINDGSGYMTETYEISNKLEFKVNNYPRKTWIDRKTKTLEDYLPIIFTHIEKNSQKWADWREKQRIQEAKDKLEKKIEEERLHTIAIENAKIDQLLTDAAAHEKANSIRTYLKAIEKKTEQSGVNANKESTNYLEWGYKIADQLDPLIHDDKIV
jgi:hypothetical protein